MPDYSLIHADCLDALPGIGAGSVDLIACDLPYGTTACAWDTVIPFPEMWKEVKRVLKPNGVFLTTASQPFTSALVMSNPKWFRHDWKWNKTVGGNPLIAKYRPVNIFEDILVFSKGRHTYNPIMGKKKMKNIRPLGVSKKKSGLLNKMKSGVFVTHKDYDIFGKYPTNEILLSSRNKELNSSSRIHPTQKPVDLYRYLIRTYSNPGETVLDFACGSCTTGVAALLEGRRFIGMELYPLPGKPIHETDNPDYFGIASRRMEDTARLLRKEFKPLTDNGARYDDLPMFK